MINSKLNINTNNELKIPEKNFLSAQNTQARNNLNQHNALLTTDKADFSMKNITHSSKIGQKNNYFAFTGKIPTKNDIDIYLKRHEDYKTTANMHNEVLSSYLNPASAREISITSERLHKTRDQLLDDCVKSMMQTFDILKDSEVIVINGTNPTNSNYLDDKKYIQIKNIYINLLDRPETFNRFSFDADDNNLERTLSDEQINQQTKDFKHIINDLLPELLKSKTFILDDPANLNKLLNDEVVQSLIVEKLAEEISKDETEHCHKHEHNEHEHHNEADNESSDEKLQHYMQEAEEKLSAAIETMKTINEKFNITTLSKVPENFYDPLGKLEDQNKESYNKKLLGLRQEPKNFYEAKLLNKLNKNTNDFDPANTIIVTPKAAANDIIEKVKTINKGYLFIEDWLYKYCLGDKKTKDEILEKLNKSVDDKPQQEFKSIGNELDDYLKNYIKVYDIKNPANNSKLTESLSDFGKVNCMNEISRGYFLGIGEDSRELIKMFLGLGFFIEMAEKASDATGIGVLENVANTVASSADSIASACSNYLHWKNELGDKTAKENFEKTITNILTFALPTSLFKLSPNDKPINHFLFRNLSAVDAYSGTIESLGEYSKKLKELMQKGIKNPPDEIKNDPDKVSKWKLTETWKAFTAHSLNRGQALGIIASQPFALMSHPILQAFGPARPALIALAGTLECWVSSIYLLYDNAAWGKFSNKLKQSLVEDKNTGNISPEKFLDMRKTLFSKAVDSNIGQAGLSTAIEISKHIPEGTTSKIKSGYNTVSNVVNKSIGRHVSAVLIKYLDSKYDKMTDDQRINITDGHHHHH